MITKPYTEREPLRLSVTARILRFFSTALLVLFCTSAAAGLYFWHSLPNVSPLSDTQTSITITVRDWEGQEQPFVLGPRNPDWTPFEQFPEYLPWAVIVAEDGAFYKHRGFDPEAMREALLYDLEQKRLARGASTITQQLAKNIYLSREKTLMRKIRELAIAWQLEKHLSKERILELYLNLVELGPMIHGMTAGARYHHEKPVSALSAAESSYLAAILPGPRVAFNPEKNPIRVRKRADQLLYYMLLRREISDRDYFLAREETSYLSGEEDRPVVDPYRAVHVLQVSPDTDRITGNSNHPPWHLPPG